MTRTFVDAVPRSNLLTCISHRLSAAGPRGYPDKAVSTSLRLVTVLDVLSKYASAGPRV
jgi:hypothetical protein